MSPEQFRALTVHGFGSLRSTLVHTLEAECVWRMLCRHSTLDYFRTLKEEGFPHVDSLQQDWQEEEHAMGDYLAQHRAEAAAILTGYGHSPGGLDFTLMSSGNFLNRHISTTVVQLLL